MVVILGITGPIGSGKSTFAAFLRKNVGKYQEYESSDLIMAVANALKIAAPLADVPMPDDFSALNAWLKPLPSILAEQVRVSVTPAQIELTEQLATTTPELLSKLIEYLTQAKAEPTIWGEQITRDNKPRHRALLQWLGGYLPKRVDGKIWYDELVRRALSRPDSDLATIGGVRFPDDAACIKAAGGFIIRIERPQLQTQDKNDVTERERDLISADAVIVNDGGLEDLEACAGRLWRDLHRSGLQPSYACHKA